MEAGRTLLSSPPPFPARATHSKNTLSVPTASPGRNFPTSVLLQEPRDEFRPPFPALLKEDAIPRSEMRISIRESRDSWDLDQLVHNFNERRSVSWPDFWNLDLNLHARDDAFPSRTMKPVATRTTELVDVEPSDVIDLAKRALSASKRATSLLAAESTSSDDYLGSTSLGATSSSNILLDEVKIVRSTKRLQRGSICRKVPEVNENFHPSRRNDVQRKTSEGFAPNDPLRFFLWGPETKQLLTAKEESELIFQVQDLMRLEDVKGRLQLQFSRKPTFFEWAKAVGVTSSTLKSQLHFGRSSRERLINANLRMVVHIAKQYQGRGMSLQDLLQEGTMGLMKSIEKFKPQVGCRFATYSYWWIRQTIRRAIFQHSRTIRLPENVYGLLGKVAEAKRSYIQEGNHNPAKEEIARRVGITVDRLEKLLFTTRMPLSMDQPVWADQNTTFQEITADTEIEIPDVSVMKQLMRQHVRGLLNILKPKERRIIRLRYGIEDGKQKSLSEIGNLLGCSKERVRQLETRAMGKLKQCLGSHGLKAYSDLLV